MKRSMCRKDRYDTTGLEQDQFEPGSHRRVLKNLLGITSKREMDRVEGREQVRALECLLGFTIRNTDLLPQMYAEFTRSGLEGSIHGQGSIDR